MTAHTCVFASSPRTRGWDKVVLLIGAAAAIAFAVVGHYAKPHIDFFEFRETGRALLAGELPATSKRGPVFPILIALVGEIISKVTPWIETPDARAAEIIGAAALVAIAGLALGLLRRWGVHATGAWTLLVVLIPGGLQWAALGLVEPLLVALVLAANYMHARGSQWAFAFAAAASVTRRDAVGVLFGVWIAGAARRTTKPSAADSMAADEPRYGAAVGTGIGTAHGARPDVPPATPSTLTPVNTRHREPTLRALLIRIGLSAFPAACLLLFTVMSWSDRSRDHYLDQLFERPAFDPAYVASVTLRSMLPAEAIAIAFSESDAQRFLASGLRATLGAGAVFGGLLLIRMRLAHSAPLIAFALVYAMIHAVFPFQFERFGYPLAVIGWLLLALAASRGIDMIRQHQAPRSAILVTLLTCIFGILTVAVLAAEWERLMLILRRAPQRLLTIPVAAGVGAIGIALAEFSRRPSVARVAGGGLLLALVAVQTRSVLMLLGRGDEMRSLADAARWVARETQPADRVLSAIPGLLALHSPSAPPLRFVGLEQLRGPDLAAILEECRGAGVRYIIWYDDLFAEQGEYYIRKWGLERYSPLDADQPSAGLELIHQIAGPPRVRVFRVE